MLDDQYEVLFSVVEVRFRKPRATEEARSGVWTGDTTMMEGKVTVKAAVGLHARPAAAFVQEAMKHKCRIQVESLGKKTDGKSILQVLALGVKCGQEIIVRAEGDGEAQAVDALVSLVNSAVWRVIGRCVS